MQAVVLVAGTSDGLNKRRPKRKAAEQDDDKENRAPKQQAPKQQVHEKKPVQEEVHEEKPVQEEAVQEKEESPSGPSGSFPAASAGRRGGRRMPSCNKSESFSIIRSCSWTLWLINNIISKVVTGTSSTTRGSYFQASPSETDMQHIERILSQIRAAPQAEHDGLLRHHWPIFGLTGSYDEKLAQAGSLHTADNRILSS